jgi:hypothetical protein
MSMLTVLDPALYRSLTPWAKTLTSLREQLVRRPHDWRPLTERNYETVVNKQMTVAITVATGDASTGLRDRQPSTSSAKGSQTGKAVDGNQLSFFYLTADDDQPSTESRMQTWLLLHYYDRQAREIRIELSLPTQLDEQGFPAAWLERIILKPISLEVPPLPERKSEPVVIEVRRKSSAA